MFKRKRFIIGGIVILAALSYIIYGGMQEAIVYFVTPSELKAKERASADKFLRMGGMVVTGSLQKDFLWLLSSPLFLFFTPPGAFFVW